MINIQWFPGHMAKTRRLVTENLKLVDVVIELLDARIPRSSRNPEIDKLISSKPRVVALNKSDLADPEVSKKWSEYYKENNISCIFIDSIKGTGINQLKEALRNIMKEKIDRERQKGRIFRSIRTMVVGIPNVGKSSFINRIAGKAIAVTGDRPGVTRSKQWIRLNQEIELLDTPGILWPKFDDPEVGLRLAYTGAIKDDIYDTAEVSSHLLVKLRQDYSKNLIERFKLQDKDIDSLERLELLELIGRKRGCIVSGGEIDYYRAAAIVLDEFRGGKIGKITLDKVDEPEEIDNGQLTINNQ